MMNIIIKVNLKMKKLSKLLIWYQNQWSIKDPGQTDNMVRH